MGTKVIDAATAAYAKRSAELHDRVQKTARNVDAAIDNTSVPDERVAELEREYVEALTEWQAHISSGIGQALENAAVNRLEDLNFLEWWTKYNESYNHPVGGKEWLAAMAAWQYSEVLNKQKARSASLHRVG